MAAAKKGTSKKLTGKEKITLKESAGSKYTLMDDIKNCVLYGKSSSRDEVARNFIDTKGIKINGSKAVPGQLILFKYFEPKTKEELEYYDASPCTIFFGVFNSSLGKRVLGFNIHYYPPKLRYQIMDKIFQMYRPILVKYFKEGNTKEMDAFDYKYLVDNLNRANLGFGVREYIPNLMAEAKMIPPNMWKVAVFTEGWFKKMTRTAIMKFWEKWTRGTKKSGNKTDSKYKTRSKK